MKILSTDVAVIGAGTAGLAAYRAAKAAGKRAVIIERGPHGTTCARVGCMPSKLLIAAAEAAHAPARWQEFGLRLHGKLDVDGAAVMARVRRERDRFVGFVLQGGETIPADDKLTGHAQFIAPGKLAVNNEIEVNFSSAVIATGSSPVVPAFLRPLGDRLVVNDDIFEWTTLPRSVAVFGPGVIGLELGQALSRLGLKVWMFGARGGVGPFSDPEVRDYAAYTFGAEFYLDPGANILGVAPHADGAQVRFTAAGGTETTIDVDYVIAATGRAPNIADLSLDRLGIALDASGVPLFSRTTMQCGGSPVFIAGDANNDVPLLHEAADEGRIAGENAASYPQISHGLRRVPLGIVFTDPQLAVIGSRRADLVAGTYVVGAVSFEDQGRSRVMLRNRGLLHLYADAADGRFLGAEMIGPDAEHLAHLLAWALQMKLTISQMLEMPFYHPVVEEGLRTSLRHAQLRLDALRQPTPATPLSQQETAAA
jgi:dihydrolipoamide dehydrogenase